MNAAAVDLLLRVAAERLGGEKCSACGGGLRPERMTVHAFTSDELVVEVPCRSCGQPNRVQIRPDVAR